MSDLDRFTGFVVSDTRLYSLLGLGNSLLHKDVLLCTCDWSIFTTCSMLGNVKGTCPWTPFPESISLFHTPCCSCTRPHLIKFSVESIKIQACKIERAIRQRLPLDRTFRLNYIRSCKNIKEKRAKRWKICMPISNRRPLWILITSSRMPGVDTRLDSGLRRALNPATSPGILSPLQIMPLARLGSPLFLGGRWHLLARLQYTTPVC